MSLALAHGRHEDEMSTDIFPREFFIMRFLLAHSVASKPSMTGICKSISTASKPSSSICSRIFRACRPSSATLTHLTGQGIVLDQKDASPFEWSRQIFEFRHSERRIRYRCSQDSRRSVRKVSTSAFIRTISSGWKTSSNRKFDPVISAGVRPNRSRELADMYSTSTQ